MVEKTAAANNGGVPEEQWAIQLLRAGEWVVQKAKIPQPVSGQVLVRVECAPINPSDTYFLAGMYDQGDADDPDGMKFKYPITPGWEGSGTVIASGGGIMAWRLVGKRVAVTKCSEPNKTFSIGGCYQQYMVTSAMQCIPLPDEVSFEQGSMHCVNPLTAIGLLDKAKDYKAQAVIQTAAASQLGRMIVTLAREQGTPLINVVRREEQVKLLQEMGAEHILNSSEPDFFEKLQELARKLRATVCLEAISGKFTGQIMSKMPSNSVCILYGVLSEQPVGDLDPLLLIGRNQRLEGFLLNEWLLEKSMWKQLSVIRQCQRMMSSHTFKSEVAKRISLFEVREAIPEYKANMTLGKYLVYPHQEKPAGQDSQEESKKE